MTMIDQTNSPSDLHASDACLTSHVLDASSGKPAAGMTLSLFHIEGDQRREIECFTTTKDGRLERPLLTSLNTQPGRYEIEFQTKNAFLGNVAVTFDIENPLAHHHVPLVVSPFGFSTYRGAPPHRPASGGSPAVTLAPDLPTGSAPAPGSVGAGVTIHAIDISRGIGAGGLPVTLIDPDNNVISSLLTTAEGRTAQWLAEPGSLISGQYELRFDLFTFYSFAGVRPFFPIASAKFRVDDPTQHFHIPLLVTPWAYSCYRGS